MRERRNHENEACKVPADYEKKRRPDKGHMAEQPAPRLGQERVRLRIYGWVDRDTQRRGGVGRGGNNPAWKREMSNRK
ncbi:hypothetical protein NDU88_000409 [Pleurodeles waltl]|uniref:Uncharacterized protein n=1 Tax=Pleurodeles waltl TaxID=8319 RepID=A0AAV7N808_PLEWA|nr:hypothetical protein NDU88_000409 [Pleurodeles waltl]